MCFLCFFLVFFWFFWGFLFLSCCVGGVILGGVVPWNGIEDCLTQNSPAKTSLFLFFNVFLFFFGFLFFWVFVWFLF